MDSVESKMRHSFSGEASVFPAGAVSPGLGHTPTCIHLQRRAERWLSGPSTYGLNKVSCLSLQASEGLLPANWFLLKLRINGEGHNECLASHLLSFLQRGLSRQLLRNVLFTT